MLFYLRPTNRSTNIIDNYREKEKDIAIASLVKSNDRGDIGFMAQQQRLNELLSRARYGLVLTGNAETLRNSPSGG